MEMVRRLKRLGLNPKIGVTTGNVFAAEVGNERRCEFAVIGDVVNLSARLMVAAGKLSKSTKSNVDILCDKSTWKVARTHIRFRAMEPIHVKVKKKIFLFFSFFFHVNADFLFFLSLSPDTFLDNNFFDNIYILDFFFFFSFLFFFLFHL